MSSWSLSLGHEGFDGCDLALHLDLGGAADGLTAVDAVLHVQSLVDVLLEQVGDLPELFQGQGIQVLALLDAGVVALGHALDELVRAGQTTGLHALLLGGVLVAPAQIVQNGAGEEDIAVNFLGLIYIGWTLAHLILLGGMPDGRVLVFFAFVALWANDTGAYFIGITLGKRRPWGEISPKKSVEGAIGGIITTCVALYALNLYFGLMHGVTVILIGVVVAIIGLIGDLMESLIKRYYGVKDSGKLLPGHGGILDRFDSVMLAAPMMYYCILLAQFLKDSAMFATFFVF